MNHNHRAVVHHLMNTHGMDEGQATTTVQCHLEFVDEELGKYTHHSNIANLLMVRRGFSMPLRTFEVWHVKCEDDAIRDCKMRWEYNVSGGRQNPPKFPEDYRHVATVLVMNDGLQAPDMIDAAEAAYHLTNNISCGWHENAGVTAHVGPKLRRSTSIGDVLVTEDYRLRCGPSDLGWETI